MGLNLDHVLRDNLLSMEVEDGKPTLTAALALSTSGLLANGACLLPFLVLKTTDCWAEFPFCGWALLRVTGSALWKCLRPSLESSLWLQCFGSGWGRQVLPASQARHMGSLSSWRGCSENASWGIAGLQEKLQDLQLLLQQEEPLQSACLRHDQCWGTEDEGKHLFWL